VKQKRTTLEKKFDQLRDAVRYTDPDLLDFVDRLEQNEKDAIREMTRLFRLEDEVMRLRAERP
jgi:hypothetical protein